MKVPHNGFTLEDLCRVAGHYGVYLHIGVADKHVGMHPPTITIQVSSKKEPQPVAFAMEFVKGNPQLNLALSHSLLQYVERIAPRRMQIITGL